MAGRPAPKPEGVLFPVDSKGERSTTSSQKDVFASLFTAIGKAEIATEVRNEKNWRKNYTKYVLKHVKTSLNKPENAIQSAKAGLEALHSTFDFIRDDKTYKFAEAMNVIKGTFETGFVKGEKPKPEKFEFEVPYKGRTLKGEALVKQVEKWRDYGTIEPSAAEAIIAVARNSKWTDLSDSYFVLLGAGSAMGPFLVLLALGANVIAVDLDRAPIWKRLIETARNSPGTLTFPLKVPQKDIKNDEELYANAGSNLITQAPEINNWLQTVYPDKNLIVGCYVYLDGEAHVRVVLACDAIIKGMCDKRKSTIAFLCTPTDAHVIPKAAHEAAKNNYNSKSPKNLLLLPIKLLFGKKVLIKNVVPAIKPSPDKEYFIVDGLVVDQGPNYALAKRMQHWRCIVAREQGCKVSSNVAPSTATASVVHNRQFAWAYDGMPYFKPLEIFQQETSNAVMGALLINDIRNEASVSNPSFPLSNPLEIFRENSFHGGIWRCGYTVGSIGAVSVLIHFAKVLKLALVVPILVVLLAIFLFFL